MNDIDFRNARRALEIEISDIKKCDFIVQSNASESLKERGSVKNEDHPTCKRRL